MSVILVWLTSVTFASCFSVIANFAPPRPVMLSVWPLTESIVPRTRVGAACCASAVPTLSVIPSTSAADKRLFMADPILMTRPNPILAAVGFRRRHRRAPDHKGVKFHHASASLSLAGWAVHLGNVRLEVDRRVVAMGRTGFLRPAFCSLGQTQHGAARTCTKRMARAPFGGRKWNPVHRADLGRYFGEAPRECRYAKESAASTATHAGR